MLTRDQHILIESCDRHWIMSMVTADYYFPDWGCCVDFFQFGVEKLLEWLRIEPTTLDLSTQILLTTRSQQPLDDPHIVNEGQKPWLSDNRKLLGPHPPIPSVRTIVTDYQMGLISRFVFQFTASSYNYLTILYFLKVENVLQEIKDEYCHSGHLSSWMVMVTGCRSFFCHWDLYPGRQDESLVCWPLIHCPPHHSYLLQ